MVHYGVKVKRLNSRLNMYNTTPSTLSTNYKSALEDWINYLLIVTKLYNMYYVQLNNNI